ncbi:hypothetical protein [Erythrobacter alti]|uniref:hypothetical protein n=1 Tax=Erythrobacter alti TaxID=1896145 RepID=UPI0030F4AAD6
MRKFTILLAAAPLALLAACGDSDTDVSADTDADLTAMDDSAPADDTMASGTATAMADAGDFSGTYSAPDADGTERRISFNANDNTYSYVDLDGTERSGSYMIANDGYRMTVADFYGEPAMFTITNGELIRLQQDVEIQADTEVSGQRYARTQDDDVVFSREPELGSPVAPQD